MQDLKSTTKRSLDELGGLLRAIQARGGYKYREAMKATDKELDEFIASGVPRLQIIVMSLVVAETMLKERKLLVGGDRWGEYEERRQALLASLKEKAK
jgi:hypothetical protein